MNIPHPNAWWSRRSRLQKLGCYSVGVLLLVTAGYLVIVGFVIKPQLSVGSFKVGATRQGNTATQINKYLAQKQITYYDADNHMHRLSAQQSGIFFEEKDLQQKATQLKQSMHKRLWRPWSVCCTIDLPKLTTDEAILGRIIAENLSVPSPVKDESELLFFKENSNFAAVPGKATRLLSRLEAQNLILRAVEDTKTNNSTVKSSSTAEPAPRTLKSLLSARDKARSVLAKRVGFTFNAQQTKLKPADIASWVILTFHDDVYDMDVDKSRVLAYLSSIAKDSLKDVIDEKYTLTNGAKRVTQAGQDGVVVADADVLAGTIVDHLKSTSQESKLYTLKLQPAPHKSINVTPAPKVVGRTYTYRILTSGAVQGNVEEFRVNVAATLADSRSWIGAGPGFREVANGSDFDIVLTEPAVLGSYAGCGSTYSCRSGRLVMINDDRWRMASPAWTGSLRDYQHMVINHEVGHWLGLGHANCAGAGQAAPVMQQQSIDLQGCVFNPWPTQTDYNNLN